MRMHTIESMPEKSDVPSNFTLKLRKHIRSRRLEDVKQLGCDRVAQLTFGSGDTEVKLLLEFYASGNVILVDGKYRVLTLLRSHRDDAKGMATMAQHVYPIQTIRLRTPTPVETVHEAVSGVVEGSLKNILSSILAYGPQVAGFCIRQAGLNPKRELMKEPLSSEEESSLMQAIRVFEKWIDICEDKAPEGCIMVDGKGQYNDFQPLINGCPIVEQPSMEMKKFPTFDDAVCEFFSKLQGDREKSQIEHQEEAAKKKLESIRSDHAQRIKNLNQDVIMAEQKASVLQSNLHKVDAAIDSVREALAAGINWSTLGEMIKSEKHAGNPVALLIHSLKLDKNTIVLRLDDVDSDSILDIDVDLSLTAHANVASYYELKKKYSDKARRTLESNDKALAAAESKILLKLQKIQHQSSKAASGGDRTRKPYWFEKFHWFISSENYLVVSGRDAQQNELLVKRYLRKGDIYVHAELHGAASTIIKNNNPSESIPLMTLSEAGQACVARSAAWDAKVATSAYWVYPDQVSKTAPSGEYLTTGSMMIRGRKNYLASQPLVMGIGWLFKLEEGSIAAHIGERAPRSLVIGDIPSERGTCEAPVDVHNDFEDSKKAPTALEAFLDSSLQQTEQYSITSSARVPKSKAKPQPAKLHEVAVEEETNIPSLASKRGSKWKKALKNKYKDQDEEERQLAMSLLQSDGQKKTKDKKERRAQRKAKIAARKAQSSGIKNPEITQDAIENLTARLDLDYDHDMPDENEASAPLSPSKSSTVSNDSEEKSEILDQIMKEEGVEVLKEADVEKLTPILDELTGLPRPSDTILAALPVCAPYQTVSSYKYHIKLVPGTQKKGKAYRQAIDVIKARVKTSQANASTEKEVDMIKAISEKEGIEAMVGNVKLQVAGLQKLQQKQKMAKKNKKKNTST